MSQLFNQISHWTDIQSMFFLFLTAQSFFFCFIAGDGNLSRNVFATLANFAVVNASLYVYRSTLTK